MLGIGMQELILILVIALIVFGPKRLPELARSMGRAVAEFRKASEDIKESLTLNLEEEKEWKKDHTVKELAETSHETP
ncbi:MAG: twin arginine-targeting protein translocase TatB [Nitrospinae bacterium RIFCSPLOWO2_12_FULL_45_22]|nr:MAG: twin arginine-targeting protein translocase TatB [Nitrospinae bacterium RIFCSPLOWO2_12_FULL_45_22]